MPKAHRITHRLLQGVVLALCASASLAWAEEAGRIVFTSGEVQSGQKKLAVGDVVQEGDELSTGRNGYMYMKTVDNGLLVLRPSSRARIAAYHIDKDPAQTRVKLELLSGVARTVSGEGVKLARQNFRFNTPVAAIGVRGTDFTVFTDQETSNVTVLSGAVVVSGFTPGACESGGSGPCDHAASRELSAGQAGQMLQVRRGQPMPKLIQGSGVTPDVIAPPRGDEPLKGASNADPTLDPQKTDSLLQNIVKGTTLPPPPVVGPSQPVETTPVPELASQLSWGRWSAQPGQPATLDTGKLTAEGASRSAMDSYYAIYRAKGSNDVIPQSGTAAFSLAQSDAMVINSATQAVMAATLQNGYLNVDFGKATFATGFDLSTDSESFKLHSTGYVGKTGELSGAGQFVQPNNMNVNGTLGNPNEAAYIFSARLDDKRNANGVTYWKK